MTGQIKTYIDPPRGWVYGFPKEYTGPEESCKEWLVENGYPQEEIDSLGDSFPVRFFKR